MMSLRKAQIQSLFLKFILSLIIFLIIFLFVANSIESMKDKECEGEYVSFKKELDSVIGKLSFGDSIYKEFIMPCNTDRIIFVDSSVDRPLLALNSFPLLNNELRTHTANVFFYQGNNLKRAESMEEVTLSYPYFKCFEAVDNKISFDFEYDGLNSVFGNKKTMYDCELKGPRTIDLRSDDLKKMLDEIIKDAKYKDLNPKDVLIPSDCNVTREFMDKESGTDIVIKKNKDCNFIYFEKIPKCAINSLRIALDTGLIVFDTTLNFNVVKDDPLMVWHFEDGEEEILYSLKKFIDESCKDEFLSLISRSKTFSDIINESLQVLDPSGGQLTTNLKNLEDSPFTSSPEYTEPILKLVEVLMNDNEGLPQTLDKSEVQTIISSLNIFIDENQQSLLPNRRDSLKASISYLGNRALDKLPG